MRLAALRALLSYFGFDAFGFDAHSYVVRAVTDNTFAEDGVPTNSIW